MKKKNSAKNFKKISNRNLISFRSVTALALLSILFSLIIPINSLEKKNIEKRIRLAAKLQQISNNKVVYNYNQEKGVHCIANDFIKEKEHLFDTPKSLTMSPYYIFPFKFEIVNFLLEIPQIKNSKEAIGYYLLTIQLMTQRNTPKKSLKNSFREYNFTDYEDYFEPDVALFDSFPDFIPSPVNYDENIYNMLQEFQLGFTQLGELELVHNHLMTRMIDPCFYDVVYAIKSYKKFQHYFSIVLSRAMPMKLNDYYQLEGIAENNPKLSPLQKKNNQVNRLIGSHVMPSIIVYTDLINHGQPKYFSDTKKNHINQIFKKGIISTYSGNNYRPGEEIVFNYSTFPNTINLSTSYGFVLKKNIFDTESINVRDNYILSEEKVSLCKEIGCFGPGKEMTNKNQTLNHREELINYNQLNQMLLNYGRVRGLTGKFDKKTIYKKLMKYKYLTKTNELYSYIFYFSVLKNNILEKTAEFIKILGLGTIIKNQIEMIEKNFDESDVMKYVNWKTAKVKNIIYESAFALRFILYFHTNKVLDKIIEKNNDSIRNLREKYLNKE